MTGSRSCFITHDLSLGNVSDRTVILRWRHAGTQRPSAPALAPPALVECAGHLVAQPEA